MKENVASVANEPNNLVYVQARESYPKKTLVCDDQSLDVPFPELTGENVEYLGTSSDATLALSNFRFFALFQHAFINVPLMLVGSLEWKGKDLPELVLRCKDGRSFQLKFDNSENCSKWFDRLKDKCIGFESRLENIFSFAFHAWCLDMTESSPFSTSNQSYENQRGDLQHDFMNEYKRMGFNADHAWKITEINSKFSLCPSYPKLHIVPTHITDEELEKVAKFRTSRRFPSAVWRNRRTGAVVVRCSQPEVGWLSRRSAEDEYFLQSLGGVSRGAVNGNGKPYVNGVKALPNGTARHDDDIAGGSMSDPEDTASEKPSTIRTDKKVLVLDCRSYYVTVGNRLKGGGSECTEYYPNCEIQFMGLANIHSIRTSFLSLQELCSKQEDSALWLSSLEATQWLFHISLLIKTALVVVKAVEQERQHVVVHCSDGWDRTTQVCALAELLLDPFYRTIKGFRVLLEREWLAFGHKFADRCGHGCNSNDQNERCPVFLQWLDCVHQLLRQFPCSFEFNETFLVKLSQHTYSCLFGTFLCNTEQERLQANVRHRTFSVWSLLDSQPRTFRNFLYSPLETRILDPEYEVRHLLLWKSLYLSSPVFVFDTSSTATPSSDTTLNAGHQGIESAAHLLCSVESRPTTQRRNSDSDVSSILLNSESRHNTGPEFRDDTNSELYFAKSLSCKSCFDPNKYPGKGLVLSNGVSGDSESSAIETDGNTNSCSETSDIDDSEISPSENRDGMFEISLDNKSKNSGQLENSGKTENSGKSENSGKMENSGEMKNSGEMESDSEDDIKKCSLSSSSRTLVGDSSSYSKNGLDNYDNGHDDISTKKIGSLEIENECSASKLELSSQSNGHSSGHQSDSNNIDRLTSCDFSSSSSYSKIRKYLDVDGLTMVVDPVQSRLLELERSYRGQIDELQTQLQTHSCLCGGSQFGSSVKPETPSLSYPTFDGPHSLSSNTTTDTCGSWEQVDDDDVTPTLWVPDHLAATCCACDTSFSITNRKHHCRSCGKIFCNLCCSDTAPVPTEQHYDPVRVCKSCFEILHVNVQDITVSAS